MPKTREFLRLRSSVKHAYLGKKVPKKYQSRYGKRYDKRDITGLSYAIAKSKGIKIDRRRKWRSGKPSAMARLLNTVQKDTRSHQGLKGEMLTVPDHSAR